MKRVVVKIPFSKICSIVTAVCFFATTIGSNLYASVMPSAVSSCDDIFNSMSIIKHEYGKITAIQDSSSDITVVNIQDLHCHEQTQRNISEIIKTLDKNYSLKSVFMEGGYGQIDVSWINKIEDDKTRDLIIEKMLQEGYLTGAEYYAIRNSKYDLLKGIEEKDVHQANLDRLSKIIEKQPHYTSVLSKVNKEIEVLSNIYLNEKNKRFSRKINDYRNGKTDTLKFYRLLTKYVEKINSSPEKYNNIVAINLEDYPNISKYIDISRQSKDTNPRQVSIELQTLINVIKNKIPYVSYRKLLDVTNNFSDTEKLVEFLTKFCDQYNIDLSKDFKELHKFFTANGLNQKLNPVDLVNEERKLIEQIRMALSYDNTEYEISYINDFSKYFEDYLTYALTSADWKYVKQDMAKFRLLYSKYAVIDRINEISSDIDFINTYYDTNDARNGIFISNVLNNESPQQNLSVSRTSDEILKQSKEVIVVIAGGYHSETLKSMFADRKVNDIVITPNVVGDTKNANKKYDSIIIEQALMQSNALAFRIASCLSDENQKNLMAKIALDILGKDKFEKIRALVGQDIDISKIENVEIDEQKKSEVMDLIQTAVNSLVNVLPQKAGQDFFNPDIDNILLEMSLKLYDMSFYFENGPVYEIDSSEYKDKDLLGIPAEIYSRMFAGLQKGLLVVQQTKDKKTQLSIFDTLKNKNSIFAFLAKTAPVWEEILFRTIPSFVMTFNPVIGISLFIVSQIAFLFSHTIVKWLVYRDSAGNRLSFASILKNDLKNLSLPTLAVSIPYILTMMINPVLWPVATVSAIIIHYLFNNKLSIFGVFKDIQLKNKFEIKVPMEKLGIKTGDKVLITYLDEGSFLISRSIKEVNALFEALSAQSPEKRDSYQRYIYPNTFEFAVKKGGIVNIKQLADSLTRKKLNIEKDQSSITLLYRIVPLQDAETKQTTEIKATIETEVLQQTESQPEQQLEDEQYNEDVVAERIIRDELIKKIAPENVVEFDFSEFIDNAEKYESFDEIEKYIILQMFGKNLKNAFITVTFTGRHQIVFDKDKIKKAEKILYILSDKIDEILGDKIGNARGYSFFPDVVRNTFVNSSNLSLNKKLFIYIGGDREVVVINLNSPIDNRLEMLSIASELGLYGIESMSSATGVNGAGYNIVNVVMPDKTEENLYIAYMTFKKYKKLKKTLMDFILNKINIKDKTKNLGMKEMEEEYSYIQIPDLEEGESVIATNSQNETIKSFSDVIEFVVTKKNGQYLISEIKETVNTAKMFPYHRLSDKKEIEMLEENGKFYIRSVYSGISFSKKESASSDGDEYAFVDTSEQKEESGLQLNTSESAEEKSIVYDEQFDRLLGRVNRLGIQTPAIGDSESNDYRKNLQKMYLMMADKFDLNYMGQVYEDSPENQSVIKYLQILRLKNLNDNGSLISIVNNTNLNIKYRLIAFMYLKMNGINNFKDIDMLRIDFLKALERNNLDVKNSFDLSALGTGVMLVLSGYLKGRKYINDQNERDIYERISTSVFVAKSTENSTAANAGMFFTTTDPLTVAHEIGHRVLMFYIDITKGISYSTVHEIFANVISAVFAEKAGIENRAYSDSLYELFNKKMNYDYVMQEEHRAANGLLYTISEITKRLGKQIRYEFLADAIINLIVSVKKLSAKQPEVLKDVVSEYIKLLRQNGHYSQSEIEKFEAMLKEESWKTKILELFMALRSSSGTRWDYYGDRYKSIIDKMRIDIVQPESYNHGLLIIDYRNDLVVINNIIMSQPDKINAILEIVKKELGKNEYLFRSQIAKLILADLIISVPQMKQLTKHQLDLVIQRLIDKYFSDKMDYAVSEIDYPEIRRRALFEYAFVKTFYPGENEKQNNDVGGYFRKNYYTQKIQQSNEYFKYSESLPPFVPTIDTFFISTGIIQFYRKFFDFVAKKSAMSRTNRFNKTINYLTIIRDSNRPKSLAKIIYNDKTDIRYRLFALMYLRKNGFDIEDKAVITDIKKDLAYSLHTKRISVKNNFELRAVLTGVYILLEDFARQHIDKDKEIEIYKRMSEAIVLRRGKEDIGARANFAFVSVDPLSMAHELGHRILGYSVSDRFMDITIHELFAETVSHLFAQIVVLEGREYKNVLYGLFNSKVDYENVFQEEHMASIGFIELLKDISNTAGKSIRWDVLSDSIIKYISGFVSDIPETAQGVNLKNIFVEYLTQLDKKRLYTRDDLRNMFSLAHSVTKGEVVAIEILEDIEQNNPLRYAKILETLKLKIKPQKSYMNRFFKKKTQYKDNDGIRERLIFSQPNTGQTVLKTIRSEILKKGTYTKYDFETLIKLEFLIKNPNRIYSSKRELDSDTYRMVKHIVGFVQNDAYHKVYETFNYEDYQYIQSYMEGTSGGKNGIDFYFGDSNSRLTMTWLKNLLLFLVKKDDKRQRMAVAIEYSVIILGMFFPKIRNWFIKEHKDSDTNQIENRLANLEMLTAEKIKEVLGFEISSISGLNFIQKLHIVSKILTNKIIKAFNKNEHLKLNNPNVQTSYSDKHKTIAKPKALAVLLFLSLVTIVLISVLMHWSAFTLIFMIFPVMSIYTIIWSLLKPQLNKIYHKEKYESEYFSNIPETDYDYSQGAITSVTVQIPVYDESNEVIFNAITQSIRACAKYSQRSGATANIVISDDGLAPLLEGDISRENIERLLQKDTTELTDKQKQAVERIKFYRANNISFVARPKDGRKGLFKKASNLNHTYKLIDSLGDSSRDDDGTYYEGENLYIGDIILLLDKDSELNEDVISVTIPKFIKDDKLAFTQNSTLPSNEDDNYFTKFLAPFTSFLFQHIFPANAISGGLVPFVGHNGFIRTKYLREIKDWPEDRVSEDFYTAIRFQTKGYHGMYLSFKGYEFKEMVSRSYIEESGKISRYVFGLLELIFNKHGKGNEENRKILTDWMRDFLKSKDVTFFQKINFFVYPLSYLNIGAIMPMALIIFILKGTATQASPVVNFGFSIPFMISLYKVRAENKQFEQNNEKKSVVFGKILLIAIAISFMFVSFSPVVLQGVCKFLFVREPKFGVTNVDDNNYDFKDVKEKLTEYFKNNKGIFFLMIFVAILIVIKKIIFKHVKITLTVVFFTFAFVLALIVFNKFIVEAIKNWFNETARNICIKFKFATKLQPFIINKKNVEEVEVLVVNDITEFESEELVNTGLTVHGKIIWQINIDGMIVFGTKGVGNIKEIADALSFSRVLNKRIRKILGLKNNIKLNISGVMVVDEQSGEMYFENSKAVVNNDKYAYSMLKALKSMAVMYSQKTIISLEGVSNNKLYGSLITGKVRKIITPEQFEYIKQLLQQENKNISQEILNLRQQGIEIYVKENELTDKYKEYGIIGLLLDGEIYDYYTAEKTEVETVDSQITLQELENKLINSEKPLLIDVTALQNIFKSTRSIVSAYSGLEALVGSIKIKFGFKNIQSRDMENFAYNIDMNDIPTLSDNDINKMFTADVSNFVDVLELDDASIISIILNDVNITEHNKQLFLNVIKERILLKHTQQNREEELNLKYSRYGLKDKKLEILLGKALYLKMQFTGVQNINAEEDINDKINNLTPSEIMGKITELSQQAFNSRDPIAIATVIELIMICTEEYRDDDIVEVTENDLLREYKSMLAAA